MILPMTDMNQTVEAVINEIPNTRDHDIVLAATVTNFTGEDIAVMGHNGQIRIVHSTWVDLSMHERFVRLSYSVHSGYNDRNATTYAYPPRKDKEYNCAVRNIPLSQFANCALSIADAGIIITTAANVHLLQALSGNQVTFVDRVTKLLAHKYLGSGETDSQVPAATPIVILANEVNDLHQTLYVDINDAPCAIRIAHEADLGDGVFVMVRCADNTIAVHKVENWSWARSAVCRFSFLDHEWIIGTSREEVSLQVQKRASANAGKYSKNELDAIISRAVADKDVQIENLKTQLDTQAESLKRTKDLLKEALDRAAQAESKTESSIKQQLAYAGLYQSQQEQHVKLMQMEEEREKKSKENFLDTFKTTCAVVGAVLSLATLIMTFAKKNN